MRSTVAHLPRQKHFMALFCRSQSLSIEQHLRSKKVGGEERKCRPSSLADCYNDPQPSTSKSDEDSYSRDKHKHKMNPNVEGKVYGRQDEQQIKQKPPIGRKTKDENQSTSRFGPCPVSKTPKRKVDQLSPTMKYVYEFPSVTQSQSSESESVTSSQITKCQTMVTAVKPVTMTTKNVIHTASVLCDNSSIREHTELKTPEKISHAKVHPYRKPANLCVTSNNAYIGTKRLPSPKVLVTGSNKPQPTDFKKRCLDLNLPELSQGMSDSFVGLKPLDEITSEDINDLIKPLSPSDLEAYLSSLSNKAPRKLGASKLDDIPTTKCSFYLDERVYVGERSGKEANDSVTDPKDVSPAKSQCLSYDLGNETWHSPQRSRDEKCVRKLFNHSLSTPEIDTNYVLFENSSICDTNLDKVVSVTSSDSNAEDQREIAQNKTLSNTIDQIEQKQTDKHLDLHPLKSLSRETTAGFTNENVDSSQKSSKRDITLNNLSIPCSIGGVNSAMNTLVHNLESMDIDENGESLNLSCSVDHEVENHFKGEKSQNEISRKSSETDVAEDSPEHCDSSPNRDLSLCKQLLKREFQQNVKNVSEN